MRLAGRKRWETGNPCGEGAEALFTIFGEEHGLSFLALFSRAGAYPCGTVKGGMQHPPFAT